MQHPPPPPPTNFEESLQSFHITLEETRRQTQNINIAKINEEELAHLIHSNCANLEQVAFQLDGLIRFLSDGVSNVHQSFQQAVEGNGVGGGEEEEDVRKMMTQHCASRAVEMSLSVLRFATTGSSLEETIKTTTKTKTTDSDNKKKGENTIPDLNTDGQAAIARIAELGLRLSFTHSALVPPSSDRREHDRSNSDTSVTSIQTLYSSYQRKLLRKRSKPCIAYLAKLRRTAASKNCTVTDLLRADAAHGQDHDDDDDDIGGNNNEEEAEERHWKKQPHGRAITVILGEASSLIHPLAMWRNGISPSPLPPQPDQNIPLDPVAQCILTLCNMSIQALDEEAQNLGTTVGEWFISDRDVMTWNIAAAAEQQKQQQLGGGGVGDNNKSKEGGKHEEDLALLDSTLEEMAYLCQVVSRYNTFHSTTILQQQHQQQQQQQRASSSSSSPLDLHLQEQSLYYSTMETYLASKNFQRALDLASPVEIVLGCPSLKVPSVVEDASYVSTRAIERASSTLCERSVWAVGHWVCELWSTNDVGNGVCSALLEGRGCEEHKSKQQRGDGNKESKAKDERIGGSSNAQSSSFASNFLDALDEDIGPSSPSPPRSGGSLLKSAPTSGGLRGALSLGMGMVGSVSSNVVGGVTGGVAAAAANVSSSSSTGRGGKGTVDKEEEARNNAKLCVLNGLNSASAACDSLSGVFDNLLQQQQQQKPNAEGGNEESYNGGNASTNTKAAPSSSSSVSMVQLSRDELSSHSKAYRNLLRHHIRNLLTDWDGIYEDDGTVISQMQIQHSTQCFPSLCRFMIREVYNLDSTSFGLAETDERLEKGLIRPLKESRMVGELRGGKCDSGVTLVLCEEMSSTVARIFLAALLADGEERKSFSDWGSLLLSKQVRFVQDFFTGLLLNEDSGENENNEGQVSSSVGGGNRSSSGGGTSSNGSVMNTATILQQFERLNQAVTVLQLDKPSDWLAFSYGKKNGENGLTMDELRKIMSLRVDFSEDAISKICGSSTSEEKSGVTYSNYGNIDSASSQNGQRYRDG